MIFAKYLFTAEKMATPTEKLLAQKRVCPPSVHALRTSSPWSFIQPVEPLTTFRGRCELDGNVGRTEGIALEVLLVVNVDDAHNLVAALLSNLLNHATHFAISYQCNFHKLLIRLHLMILVQSAKVRNFNHISGMQNLKKHKKNAFDAES